MDEIPEVRDVVVRDAGRYMSVAGQFFFSFPLVIASHRRVHAANKVIGWN